MRHDKFFLQFITKNGLDDLSTVFAALRRVIDKAGEDGYDWCFHWPEDYQHHAMAEQIEAIRRGLA